MNQTSGLSPYPRLCRARRSATLLRFVLVLGLVVLASSCAEDDGSDAPSTTPSQVEQTRALETAALPRGAGVPDRAAPDSLQPGAQATPKDTRALDHVTRGFAQEATGVRATLLTIDADARIGQDGALTISPVPAFDLQGTRRAPAWRYEMQLDSIGRDGHVRAALAASRAQLDGGRYEVSFTTQQARLRYEHREVGLEQIIELDAPPPGDGPLTVRFTTSPGLTHEVDARGQQALVMRDGQPLLRWHALQVFDAERRRIPARMVAQDGALSYVIDDADAVYPLLIDPLASAPDRALFGGDLGARFGVQAKIVGDLNNDGFDDLAVAQTAYSNPEVDEGRVLIFLGTPTGVSPVANLAIESNTTNAQFGTRIRGGDVNNDGFDDLLVSSPNTAEGGNNAAGRAWLYLGQATPSLADPAVRPAPAWTAAGSALFESFGQSATLADLNCDGHDEVIIGAQGAASFAGEVRVYFGQATPAPGASPLVAAPLILDSPAPGAAFGASVAGLGNVNADTSAAGVACEDLLVGAPMPGGVGAAYLYFGDPSGTPVRVADLSGTQIDARFGDTVSEAGDVNGDGFDDMLVAAIRYRETFAQEGRVSLFLGGDAATMATRAEAWSALGGATCARLGSSMTTLGDMFEDGRDELALSAPFIPSTDACRFQAGYDANAGGFVRAYFGDTSIATPDAWDPFFVWEETSEEPGARFGFSISGGGSLNGDAIPDLAIGAFLGDSTTISNVGGVFVYLGKSACFLDGALHVAGAANPASRCEVCDPVLNAWVALSDGDTCDTGDLCVVDGVCQSGACVGQPLDCSDDDACTADRCEQGICFNPITPDAACDDGNFCTINDTCDAAGACSISEPNPCDEVISECASAGVCNQATQRCVPDINTQTPDDTPCGASDLCVTDGTCQGGLCVGDVLDCTALDAPCAVGRCDSATGCYADALPDDSACSDGDACTADDVCLAGVCASGPDRLCDDDNPCTANQCDSATGCSHPMLPDETPCGDPGMCSVDGLLLDPGPTCQAGACIDDAVQSCAPFLCAFGRCLDACSTDSDCTQGTYCSADSVCSSDNRPPVADAGLDQAVDVGDLVTLDGSASADPDGDALTFAWTQVEGPVVTLSGADEPTPSFIAPRFIAGEPPTLVFELTVSDGLLDSEADTAEVAITNLNNTPPIARIEGPLQALPGQTITLNADTSSDPDGDTLTYSWSLLLGAPAPILGDLAGSTLDVTFPEGISSQTGYIFSLVVNDGSANSPAATHTVLVIGEETPDDVSEPGDDVAELDDVSEPAETEPDDVVELEDGVAEGGCGCQSVRDERQGSAPWLWTLALVGGVVLRRRRRDRQA